MSAKKLYTSSTGWYSIEYAAEWRVEESQELVTFYKPEIGVGALQISAFRTPEEQDTRNLLFEYLSDKDLPLNRESIPVREEGSRKLSGYHYVESDWYRHVWMISQACYFLFVTYNCKLADKGKELDDVLAMVSSVIIYSS